MRYRHSFKVLGKTFLTSSNNPSRNRSHVLSFRQPKFVGFFGQADQWDRQKSDCCKQNYVFWVNVLLRFFFRGMQESSDVHTWSMQRSRLRQYLCSCQVLLATGVWDSREMSVFFLAKQWRPRILGADVTLSLWYLEMKTEERMEDIMSKPSHLTSACVMRELWNARLNASICFSKNNSYLL